jgi:hypothetical protein
MAEKRIKVKVDVETDVEPSLKQLRELKKELRATAAGSEEFIALQRKIDDIQDSLVSARAGAGNFADVLGALPGPIGAIGGQASGLITTLKQFGALNITNIQSSFVELGADLSDVAKGFFNLTGITKVYTTLNTALARSFVAVGIGETAAAAGAKAFAAALTATGIGALVVGLGLLIANWDKVTDAIKGATAESKTYEEAQTEVTKSVTDFNKQLINVQSAFKAAREGTISKKDALKTYNDTIGKSVGFAGSLEQAEALLAANTTAVINGIKLRTQANVFYAKSAEAAAKAVSGEDVDPSVWESVGNYIISGGNSLSFMVKQAETVGKKYGKLNEQVTKFEAEGDKLTKAAIENDKLLKKGLAAPPDFSATTKASNDALAEIKKGLEEARLTLLGEQARELELVKLKYDELAAKAKKYGKDSKIIEEAREKENSEIRDKFAKQQLEKDDKAAKDALDLKEKALTEAQKALTDATALEEAQLNLKLAKGEVTERDYQTKLFDIRKNAAIQNELLVSETLKKEQDSLNNQRIADLANLQIALQNETITQEQFDAKKLEIQSTYQTNVDTLNADALAKNKDFIAAQIDLEKFKTDQKKLSAEEERQILLNGLQSEFEALDRANKQSELDFEQDMVRFGEQRILLAEMEAADLANEDLTEFQKTEIRKKYADQRTAIVESEIATERAAMQAKHDINMAYLGLFEQFGNLLSQIAGKNKGIAIAGIIISQASAIGQIIANTAIANAKSVAALPLTLGQPWVAINTISAGLSIASTIASAAKSIAQIKSQPGGSGGGASASASAGSAAQLPKPPTVSGASAPQIQSGQGVNATTQIAQTIGAAQKPIRAYVVSGEVSSQQALDRRTSRAATFTGG